MPTDIFKRGQIWWVNLNKTTGSEIRKQRPCVIVSSNAANWLPVKIIVPLTDWKTKFNSSPFHIQIQTSDAIAINFPGLNKVGAADVMQIRCVSFDRFINQIGQMNAHKMEEIAAAIASIIEYE